MIRLEMVSVFAKTHRICTSKYAADHRFEDAAVLICIYDVLVSQPVVLPEPIAIGAPTSCGQDRLTDQPTNDRGKYFLDPTHKIRAPESHSGRDPMLQLGESMPRTQTANLILRETVEAVRTAASSDLPLRASALSWVGRKV